MVKEFRNWELKDILCVVYYCGLLCVGVLSIGVLCIGVLDWCVVLVCCVLLWIIVCWCVVHWCVVHWVCCVLLCTVWSVPCCLSHETAISTHQRRISMPRVACVLNSFLIVRPRHHSVRKSKDSFRIHTNIQMK